MSRPVFILDAVVLAAATPGCLLVLDGDEGRHAVAVRRLRVGEELDLVDGDGVRAHAQVETVEKGSLSARVLTVFNEPHTGLRVVVAQALAKGDRGETAVETMTEVGVDEIIPWQASRCVVRWSEGKDSGIERWRRTSREAAKQSRRARFPVIGQTMSTQQLVERARSCAAVLVLDETAGMPIAGVDLPSSGDVMLIVGPEGGIAPEERSALEAQGAVAVRLGPTVLRSSTAGTVAATVVLARSERWASGG